MADLTQHIHRQHSFRQLIMISYFTDLAIQEVERDSVASRAIPTLAASVVRSKIRISKGLVSVLVSSMPGFAVILAAKWSRLDRAQT